MRLWAGMAACMAMIMAIPLAAQPAPKTKPKAAPQAAPKAATGPSLPLIGYNSGGAIPGGVPVPPSVQADVDQIYRIYAKQWALPNITIRKDGRPVGFYQRRSKPGSQAAFYGNGMPFNPPLRNPLRVAFCTGIGTEKENWCSEPDAPEGFSVTFNEDRAGAWNFKLLASHEFIHAMQYDMLGRAKADAMPPWVLDGMANGFGYGLMENLPGLSRWAILRRTAMLEYDPETRNPSGNFSFFSGLRFYDHALDVDSIPGSYPRNHPEYYATADEPGGHIIYAGYMTGSFFRHMLRGRPGGLKAVKHMMKRPAPSANDSRAWLSWMDNGLKSDPSKTWPRGVRQVYAEMIAELADLPDLKGWSPAKDRYGKAIAERYDKYLWSDGCKKVDLTTSRSWAEVVPVRGLAARCFRVKLPPDGLDMTGEVAKIVGPNLPPVFTVTASSTTGGCKDFELASRAEVVPDALVFETKGNPLNCLVKWVGYYLPLNPADPQGLQGWQTVLLINAPSRPAAAKGRLMQVTFVRPQAEAAVEAEAIIEDRIIKRKVRKRAPKPGPKPIPVPKVPLVVDPAPAQGCDAETTERLECGNELSLKLGYGQIGDLTAQTNGTAGIVGHMYNQAQFTRENYVSVGEAMQKALFETNGGLMANLAAMATSGVMPSGATVELVMPQLREGEIGTFPARVVLNWNDGADKLEARVDSLAAKELRSANGCSVVWSKRSDASVTITMNDPGGLVGSVSARLYQENPDTQDACRTPILSAGTLNLSFATPGVIYAGPDGFELNTEDMVERQMDAQSIAAQVLIPMEERSDHLVTWPDGLYPGARSAGGGGAGKSGAPDLQCSEAITGVRKPNSGKVSYAGITNEDFAGFIRAVQAADGEEAEPMDPRQEAAMAAMDKSMFAPMICTWIAKGRPAKYKMEEE